MTVAFRVPDHLLGVPRQLGADVALALAVYASQDELSRPTQDSLPAGGHLRRAGLPPAGSLREVSENGYVIFFPLRQASPGATSGALLCVTRFYRAWKTLITLEPPAKSPLHAGR